VLVVLPIALGGAFLAMLVYISARVECFPHPGHQLAKFSEWPETIFALALAVFALLAWRRVDAGQ
jgi:membrane protein implicated in regulation of membrane protease activity